MLVIHKSQSVALVLSLCLLQVHSQFNPSVNTDLLCQVPEDSPMPTVRRTLDSNCTECFPGLDFSTDCSTCEGESIQCVEGEQNCGVGSFTFSAMFHSYKNPNHLCTECNQTGDAIITCGAAGGVDPDTDCGLRFMYCLRPHGSPVIDVPLPAQYPLSPGTDNITFPEDSIIQINTRDRGNNVWNRSNPFTKELRLWPGRVQFYIVVYHFRFGFTIPHVVDRFQIDLELNITSDFAERKSYYGLQNLTQFDMSFKVAEQCSDNYYVPQCDVFCSEVEGQFTCDSEGNTVCVNSNLNPETNCTECLVVGQDPDNNCTYYTTMSSTPSSSALVGGVVGGVLGGVLGGILLLVVVLLLLVCLIYKVNRAGHQDEAPMADVVNTLEDMTENQVPLESAAGQGTRDSIIMEVNVVYGVMRSHQEGSPHGNLY